MKRTFYLLVFFMAGMFISATAQTNWVGIHQSNPAPADVRLVESNIQETKIQFSLDGFNQTPVRTFKGVKDVISIGEGVQIMEKGMPDLPKLVTTIIIPDLDEMEVNVISSKYEEFTDVEIAPSKGHFTRDIRPQDVPFVFGDAYEQDEFWPGKLAGLDEPFIMRDFRGQSVSVFPFQYNPATKTLRVYTDLVVEVTPTGEQGKDPLVRTRDQIVLEPEFGRIYNRFFLNMGTADKTYPMLDGEEGSMLIIAYDNFMGAMQPFIDWKRTLGRRVEMVPKSDAGNTATAIKSFVQNYYNDNDDFAYLLLIGDGPQIPPMTTSNGHSDNAYGFLEGTNSYNDIFVGRFSSETVAHVETQVQRTIEYERDLDESDTWLSNALGVARNEGAGGGHHGEADHVHMNFIRDTLLNFTYDVVHQRYDGPGFSTSAAEISADINSGVSAINFCNHGSVTGWSVAGYNISHVNNLENTGKLPYLTNVACVNGNFVNNFCFAEAWMRATDSNGNPTGTVANMSSTINQLWQPPMCGQDEMVSIKTEESIPLGPVIKRTYGGVSINGSMFMIPQYGGSGIQTHETWILFGDPSLMIRTAAPTAFDVTYNPVILIGTDYFDITVDDADGAVVAITHYDEVEEEVVILGTAVVEDGMATVNFENPPEDPGELTLAISGFNKVTYINEEIQVIPPDGPYVVFDHYIIDDSQGNNNGLPDYGEFISLDVSLKNVGIDTAENTEATLSTESEYITIIDNHYVWGDIADDEEVMMEGAFTFQIADNIPDQTNVLFVLDVTDGEDTWTSNFSIRMNAPCLVFDEYYVDAEGERSETLEPGQEAELVVSVKNSGHSASLDVLVDVMPQSFWITLHTHGGIGLDPLEPGEAGEAAFQISAQPLTPPENAVEVLLVAETGEYYAEESMSIVVGAAPYYTEGNIPSTYHTSPNTNTLAQEPGVINLTKPAGAVIDSVGVEYRMTSHGGAWIQEQRSYLRCVSEGGTAESAITSGPSGMSGGQVDYARNGLNIADGVDPDSTEVTFELHLFRTWGGSGSNTQYIYGNNETWKVVMYYSVPGHEVDFLVKNPQDEPIENATVKITHVEQQTNETGETSFNLPAGSFYYSVWADGYFPVMNEPLEVEGDPEEPMLVEVILNPEVTHNVTFLVEDEESNPIDDATVTFGGQQNEPGDYLFEGFTPGIYSYTVEKPGFFIYQEDDFLLEDDALIEVTLIEMETYTVTFTVEDEENNPIENAMVTFDGQQNEPGDYVFEYVEPGTYSYTVEKEGFFPYAGEFLLEDDDAFIEVTLTEETYTVTFDIEDEGGNTIENAVITLDGQENEPGDYVFEYMAPGTYSYSVSKEGYEDAMGEVTVVDDDVMVDIVLVEETEPIVYPLPFYDDFEGYVDHDDFIMNSDWTIIDANEDGFNWFLHYDEVDDINVMASRSWDNVEEVPIEPHNFLITPALEIPALGENEFVELNYYVAASATGLFEEHYKVVVSTTGNSVEDFIDDNIVFEETLTEEESYWSFALRSIDISQFENQTIYIAIVHYDCEDQDRLLINSVEVKVETDVSVPETLTPELAVFPNPARSVVHIQADETIKEVRMIDMLGQVVYSEQLLSDRYEMNVSGFQSGIYFIQVLTESGTITHKIQIQK